MGYGLLSVNGSTLSLIEMDTVHIPVKLDTYHRLELIHRTVQQLIILHRPHAFAIEAPFYGKNVQSMLKLGRAQGVAIAAAIQAGIPVTEYAPRKIKQSVTGNGSAGKEQVWKMLQQILRITEPIKMFDASDALAVALCHHFQAGSPVPLAKKSGKDKGWSSFLAGNAHRVK